MKNKLIQFLIFICMSTIQNYAQSTNPYQFISKLYSEAYGRVPDTTGWKWYQSQMDSAANIGSTALKNWMVGIGRDFYKDSSEFTNKYISQSRYYGAMILALYRGALNREPELTGYTYYLGLLNSGTTWNSVVDDFFRLYKSDGITKTEFHNLADTMIARASNGKPYYGWGSSQIQSDMLTPYPTSGITTETALRSAIASGGTVEIAQMAVIPLSSQLIIPSNVTITTYGNPSPDHYAMMGRIIRGPNYTCSSQRNGKDSALVVLNGSNSCITNVWIDGQVEYFKTTYNAAVARGKGVYNLKINPTGNSTKIKNCRFSETGGFTNIAVDCWSNSTNIDSIKNNLITCYGSNHTYYLNDTIKWWVDGISIHRANTVVQNNSIIDATDVGIVLYFDSTSSGPRAQNSIVSYNTIFNAGNSIYAGLASDPYSQSVPTTFSFSGASFRYNLLYTSNKAHMDLGIAIGTRSWFSSTTANTGSGTSTTYNTLKLNANVGVLVNGMTNTVVNNNYLYITTVSSWGLPTAVLAKNSAALYASFSTTPQGTFSSYNDSYLYKTNHSNLLKSCLYENRTNRQKEYSLCNYPNPFNPTTNIIYYLAEKGYVKLQIYNILGQKVAELINSVQDAGDHIIYFDGSNLSSGIYISRLQSNGFVLTKKMLLIK